jgi:hypothetical protein
MGAMTPGSKFSGTRTNCPGAAPGANSDAVGPRSLRDSAALPFGYLPPAPAARENRADVRCGGVSRVFIASSFASGIDMESAMTPLVRSPTSLLVNCLVCAHCPPLTVVANWTAGSKK